MMSSKKVRAFTVRRILLMGLRVSVLLMTIFVVACCFIAQPSTRSNSLSLKKTNTDRLREHVVAISQNFQPREWQNPQNLDRCAEYISNHLKKTGASVEMQEFEVHDRKYQNVIGRFGVGNPKKIIVGAHYDACGDAPGADDNASGVAGLLELASLIGADQQDAEVELVAYTLEEPPFFGGPQMGSAFHAAKVASERDRIIGVIVLEMIGYFSDAPGSQTYPVPLLNGYYPDRGNFITVVSRWDQGEWISDLKAGMAGTTDLPVYSFRAPASLPGVDYSDHRNYWSHGIPAAMVTNTAFYRNTEYHTEQDTADRLDYQRMGNVVVGVYEAIWSLTR